MSFFAVTDSILIPNQRADLTMFLACFVCGNGPIEGITAGGGTIEDFSSNSVDIVGGYHICNKPAFITLNSYFTFDKYWEDVNIGAFNMLGDEVFKFLAVDAIFQVVKVVMDFMVVGALKKHMFDWGLKLVFIIGSRGSVYHRIGGLYFFLNGWWSILGFGE
jgi:hypothetical protein